MVLEFCSCIFRAGFLVVAVPLILCGGIFSEVSEKLVQQGIVYLEYAAWESAAAAGFQEQAAKNVALAALDQTEANEFAADAARLEGTAVVEETEAKSGEAAEAAEGEAGTAVEAAGASDSVETAESVASAVRAAASEATASIEAAGDLASIEALSVGASAEAATAAEVAVDTAAVTGATATGASVGSTAALAAAGGGLALAAPLAVRSAKAEWSAGSAAVEAARDEVAVVEKEAQAGALEASVPVYEAGVVTAERAAAESFLIAVFLLLGSQFFQVLALVCQAPVALVVLGRWFCVSGGETASSACIDKTWKSVALMASATVSRMALLAALVVALSAPWAETVNLAANWQSANSLQGQLATIPELLENAVRRHGTDNSGGSDRKLAVAELWRGESADSCSRLTSGTCSFLQCDLSRGPTTCTSSRCMCAPGSCATADQSVCEKPPPKPTTSPPPAAAFGCVMPVDDTNVSEVQEYGACLQANCLDAESDFFLVSAAADERDFQKCGFKVCRHDAKYPSPVDFSVLCALTCGTCIDNITAAKAETEAAAPAERWKNLTDLIKNTVKNGGVSPGGLGGLLAFAGVTTTTTPKTHSGNVLDEIVSVASGVLNETDAADKVKSLAAWAKQNLSSASGAVLKDLSNISHDVSTLQSVGSRGVNISKKIGYIATKSVSAAAQAGQQAAAEAENGPVPAEVADATQTWDKATVVDLGGVKQEWDLQDLGGFLGSAQTAVQGVAEEAPSSVMHGISSVGSVLEHGADDAQRTSVDMAKKALVRGPNTQTTTVPEQTTLQPVVMENHLLLATQSLAEKLAYWVLPTLKSLAVFSLGFLIVEAVISFGRYWHLFKSSLCLPLTRFIRDVVSHWCWGMGILVSVWVFSIMLAEPLRPIAKTFRHGGSNELAWVFAGTCLSATLLHAVLLAHGDGSLVRGRDGDKDSKDDYKAVPTNPSDEGVSRGCADEAHEDQQGISAAWVGSTVLSVFTAAGIILIEAAESPTFSSAVGGAYHSLINTRYLLPLSPVVFSVTWTWVSVSPWRIAACIGVVLTLAAGIATSGVIAFTSGRKVKFGQSTPDPVEQNRSVDETAPQAREGDP
uniref:Transmembrane protein n=1 Tax=Noctiluca scintillans TaxID=2966 RepID=A0A7S1ARK2_NOCSC